METVEFGSKSVETSSSRWDGFVLLFVAILWGVGFSLVFNKIADNERHHVEGTVQYLRYEVNVNGESKVVDVGKRYTDSALLPEVSKNHPKFEIGVAGMNIKVTEAQFESLSVGDNLSLVYDGHGNTVSLTKQ